MNKEEKELEIKELAERKKRIHEMADEIRIILDAPILPSVREIATHLYLSGYRKPVKLTAISEEEIMKGYCDFCYVGLERCNETGGAGGCGNYQASLKDYQSKLQAQLLADQEKIGE